MTVDDCLTYVLVLVRACARDAHIARRQREAGPTDEERWAVAGLVDRTP